jgi:hypothetical protein
MQCPLEAILNTLSKVNLRGIKIKIITGIIPKNYLSFIAKDQWTLLNSDIYQMLKVILV